MCLAACVGAVAYMIVAPFALMRPAVAATLSAIWTVVMMALGESYNSCANDVQGYAGCNAATTTDGLVKQVI